MTTTTTTTLIPIKPMKLVDVAVTSAEDYLADPDWVLEQKHDGARAMTVIQHLPETDEYTFEWLASGGGPLKFAAAVQHFKALEAELLKRLSGTGLIQAILDGELMIEEGEYRLFDAPLIVRQTEQGLARSSDPDMPYWARRNALYRLLTDEFPVTLSQIAVEEDDKRELWQKINDAGVEGAVAKHRDSRYVYGTRSTEQVKLKLVKTADVIVTGIENWTHRTGSAALAVTIDPEDDPKPWRNGSRKRISGAERDQMLAGTKSMQRRAFEFELVPRALLPIGNASLIGKDRAIEVGSVVEIDYLYWTGDAVIQPRITRLRRPEEKQQHECRLSQFPEYSRKAL